MNAKILITLILAVAVQMTIVPAQAATNVYPANNGFELPDSITGGGAPTYGWYTTNQASWTLSYSGIAANGVLGLTNAANGNYDGTTSTFGQAAYIGGGGSGTNSVAGYIRGDVIAPILGNATVTLSLKAQSLASPNPINVFMGLSSGGPSTLLGSFTPTSETNFTTFTTTNLFNVTNGTSYRIVIFGTQTGTSAPYTFVDNVFVSIPEPSTLALVAAVMGLVLVRHLSRKRQDG